MTATLQHLKLLLPDTANDRLIWASKELMARLRLPWRRVSPGESIGQAVALVIDTALPDKAIGVQIVSGNTGSDPFILSKQLAGGFDPSTAQAIGPGRFLLPLDLAGAFEAWIGRRTETLDNDPDDIGRFRHTNSALASSTGDIAPVAELLANVILKLLVRAAAKAGLELPSRRNIWPDGKTFAVHLSHDVDHLGGRYQIWRRYLVWSAWYLKARLRGHRADARHWATKLGGLRSSQGDPEYTIPDIVEIEAKHNATSSFYFFCSRTGSARGQLMGRMYRIMDPLARQAIQLIRQAGSEIGLHGFPRDYRSARRLAKRKAHLEEITGMACTGIRQHFLCLDVPETWHAQREAGFAYDATLGWPRNVGMRAGTCMPFEIFDAKAHKPLGMMEIPLIAMDGAIEAQWPEPEIWLEKLNPLIDTVQRVGGVFSLLMHPKNFNPVERVSHRNFYEAFLCEMTSRGAWLTSGRNILQSVMENRRALC